MTEAKQNIYNERIIHRQTAIVLRMKIIIIMKRIFVVLLQASKKQY